LSIRDQKSVSQKNMKKRNYLNSGYELIEPISLNEYYTNINQSFVSIFEQT